MDCRAQDIERLLKEIGEHTKLPPVHGNFIKIYDLLKIEYRKKKEADIPFRVTYLYRRLFGQLKKKGRKSKILNLNSDHLDALAFLLGYEDYAAFEEGKHSAISTILQNCAGTWYSYVRCNSGHSFIIRAPVKIYASGSEMHMELKGSQSVFTGKVIADESNIYCSLESDKGKKLFMVMKTALSRKAKVMQGVFSGVSTGTDPIAGREVFVRQDDKYENLEHQRVPVLKFLNSRSEEERSVAVYFENIENNILKAGRSSTFDLGDLDI
ncbi:MAG TPA: hypothetical protein VK826_10180 [Bacteroidia bacterium]|nr:hypothetical protein [Bacteroidia bacterium]